MPGAWSGSPASYTPSEMMTDVILNAELRDRMLWLGNTDGLITQRGSVITADAQSTTSVTQTIIPGTSVTITTSGIGDVIVWASGAFTCTSTTQLCTWSIGMDASTITLGRIVFPATAAQQTISLVARFAAPSAAVHVFSLLYGVAGGATLATDAAISRSLVAMEVRR